MNAAAGRLGGVLSRGEKRALLIATEIMHSAVESSRGEKRGFCGVKPRDSGLSRGEKRILLLVRLNYLPTSLRA